MLSAMEIAHIEKAASKIGSITTDEAKFLTQSSLKRSVEDLLTPQDEERLKFILNKIASEELLENLRPEISCDLVDKLRNHYQMKSVKTYEYFIDKEIETGLLAESIHENYNITYSLHDEDSTAFFKVSENGGSIVISFNKNHLIYPILQDIKKRDKVAYQLFLNLFHSWGLYEMDLHSTKEAECFKVYRELWGRKLREILRG